MLCRNCKEEYLADEWALETLGLKPEKLKSRKFYKAKGCENCFQTGYKGRIAIFEIMVLDDNIKSLVLQTFDSNRIKKAALSQKMISLRLDGIQKVLGGQTTIEEVLRVTQI